MQPPWKYYLPLEPVTLPYEISISPPPLFGDFPKSLNPPPLLSSGASGYYELFDSGYELYHLISCSCVN